MKTKNVFIWVNDDGTTNAKAKIEVPGLGEVQIEQALSDELRGRIINETMAALRVKLGKVVTENTDGSSLNGGEG